MYESGPWKEDLKRRRQLLLQYNTKKHFEKDEDKAIYCYRKSDFLFGIHHSETIGL